MFNFDQIERKNIIWVQVIEWFLSIFIFLGKFWNFIIGGMLMWLDLLVSTTKKTYNHSIWNLIFSIYFLLLNYFYYISTFHLLITKLCFIIFQHHEIYNYLLKQYSQIDWILLVIKNWNGAPHVLYPILFLVRFIIVHMCAYFQ
jgi:hypothetical protein